MSPRPKAILTLHEAQVAKRGRGAKGTVVAKVLGSVTTEGGKTNIDTSELTQATVGELANVAERLGIDASRAFADGINLHSIRKTMTEQREVKIPVQTLAEELTKRGLVNTPKDARRTALEVKRIALKMKLNAGDILEAVANVAKQKVG